MTTEEKCVTVKGAGVQKAPEYKCPACAGPINEDDIYCRHCGSELQWTG